ncbi:MAG: twin transmembrane helix small protein [Gammaproteobacteria bacterium]
MPKIVVLLMLVLIIASLGSAMVYMLRGDNPQGTVRALTYRIGLSVTLFVLLMVFYKIGWITPHGVNPVQP